ncbi:MAG: MerR family transcriptional regulator [Treponema sp.]|nr:MerR family transcriptional regulator [Treponema sp.]
MKIYQVEELVGITKKNIRFYEEQKLLCPKRNPENDYREYSLEDVRQLEKIKLLRKLSVPIEDIRLIESGKLSLSQSMKGQIERIEKEEQNAQVIKELCTRLRDENTDLKTLNASFYLSEMEKMESQGTKFKDIQKEDINRKKKSGAVAAAGIFSLILIFSFIALLLVYRVEPEILVPVIVTGLILFGLVIGIIYVLIQRIKEINGGEEYDARNY